MTSSDFTGYQRSDGRWGVRNHVLVMPVRCDANFVAARIADGIDGARVISHQARKDEGANEDRVRRLLTGTATHPNLASVLLVGIDKSDDWLAEAVLEAGRKPETVSVAAEGGFQGAIDAGQEKLRQLVAAAAELERSPMPISELIVGLECGGSDALSGITANPALGVASDMLVERGATTLLAETPELIGAEEALAARAVSPEVAEQVRSVILGFERAIEELGVDVRGAQPTPGNQAGGLTTIEEKSLGAAKKGGNAPVSGVLDYAERPRVPGLHIMDTPGQDIEQMVGMVAGGAQIVAFTTGRGTPTGSPIAPCLKISTNTATFERLAGDIDLDAGTILEEDEPIEEVGARIYSALIEAAAGRETRSEIRGNREFAISRIEYP